MKHQQTACQHGNIVVVNDAHSIPLGLAHEADQVMVKPTNSNPPDVRSSCESVGPAWALLMRCP